VKIGLREPLSYPTTSSLPLGVNCLGWLGNALLETGDSCNRGLPHHPLASTTYGMQFTKDVKYKSDEQFLAIQCAGVVWQQYGQYCILPEGRIESGGN
jgi:hypothetical protein